MKTPKMQVLPIDRVEQHPLNARVHNVEAIEKSMTEFGQYQPIVVQESTGFVIAGNGRLLAARNLGWTEISAVVHDIDDERAAAMLLVDNRTSDLATYDPEALVALLESVDDLEVAGYSEQDLTELLFKMTPPVEFPTVDIDDEDFEQTCPKCGFEFNGGAA